MNQGEREAKIAQKPTVIPLSQILGQEKAVDFLKQVIAREKIPHAYLFVGVPGIGKTTAAIALAQILNCENPDNGEGCGRCRSCRQIKSGNFPELVFIEAEGRYIKIEQIRDLDHVLGFKPLVGKYRVSVIRQAETMTEEAANAFLKTLEEPPPGNMLVLTVTDPRDLLPTIVSRCQKVAFRPIPAHLIKKWLVAEKRLSEGDATAVARICNGSLGRAKEIAEGEFLGKRKEYIKGIIDVVQDPPLDSIEKVIQLVGRESKKGYEALDLLAIWKSWYRDLMVIKTTGGDSFLINKDFSGELKKVSKDFTIETLINSLFLIDQAERDLTGSRNLDLMLENIVLGLKSLSLERGEISSSIRTP
ncbi:MAG: DNA polymerase III subunit delta' [Deltaproteobacteria bacterium]|nr:DNA polymerase III subunit delta' [Deltaproteobacteria bacterium]MBW1934867.1 DNA polymerase III subunit delta' [Deltaproteobacteria bacterium]RLB33882.1 MAG: DNA polymerase III subunit delta' [Deltaproteobacteria bacterium]